MAHPTLTSDHERNTSNTMSERHAQHSHLTMIGTNPVMLERPNTYIHQHDTTQLLSFMKRHNTTFTSMIGHTYYHLWKGSALTTASMIGHNYYHLWKGTTLTSTSMVGHTYYHLWKGTALTITSMVGHTYYHLWKGYELTYDHVGANPIVTSEWL